MTRHQARYFHSSRLATAAQHQSRCSPGFHHRLLALALVAWGLAVAGTPEAHAQDLEDAQSWVQAIAIGQLSENWRSHLEVQPRVMNDSSELGLTIVRVAVGRRVSPRITLWGGYAWVPRSLGRVTTHEQRLWQQASLVGPVAAKWALTGRVRLEQRWLEPWVDTSHRLRVMGRAQRPLDARGQWSLFAYDEAFFTLDRTSLGPLSGFDRNRLSGGIGRRLNAFSSVEFGYIWETTTVRPRLRRNEQVVIGVVALALPRR